MGNEYDYKCKGFELKAVPRSEFEALKRFGDYEELPDETLIQGSRCMTKENVTQKLSRSHLLSVKIEPGAESVCGWSRYPPKPAK
jgi:hypothetical protein